MALLPDDVSAAVAAREGALAFLIRFDFLTATKWVWTGFGTLRTADGQEWDGLGEMVSIDGLGGSLSGQASAGSFTVSGVSPDLIPKAIGEEVEYKGRPVMVFFQAFDAEGARVGNPCPLALRIMTNMAISRTGTTRSITLNHESPYVGRNNPASSWYSDRDQQRRYPGDRACERVPFLVYKQERWPTY